MPAHRPGCAGCKLDVRASAGSPAVFRPLGEQLEAGICRGRHGARFEGILYVAGDTQNNNIRLHRSATRGDDQLTPRTTTSTAEMPSTLAASRRARHAPTGDDMLDVTGLRSRRACTSNGAGRHVTISSSSAVNTLDRHGRSNDSVTLMGSRFGSDTVIWGGGIVAIGRRGPFRPAHDGPGFEPGVTGPRRSQPDPTPTKDKINPTLRSPPRASDRRCRTTSRSRARRATPSSGLQTCREDDVTTPSAPCGGANASSASPPQYRPTATTTAALDLFAVTRPATRRPNFTLSCSRRAHRRLPSARTPRTPTTPHGGWLRSTDRPDRREHEVTLVDDRATTTSERRQLHRSPRSGGVGLKRLHPGDGDGTTGGEGDRRPEQPADDRASRDVHAAAAAGHRPEPADRLRDAAVTAWCSSPPTAARSTSSCSTAGRPTVANFLTTRPRPLRDTIFPARTYGPVRHRSAQGAVSRAT